MKPILTFSLLLFLAGSGLSQTRISGTVVSHKGAPIANVNILLKNTYDGASTDSAGYFNFTTAESGKQLLVISSIGYDKDSVDVLLSGTPLVLKLTLREAASLLNTVIISAGSFVSGDSKKGAVLSALEIATTAGAEADIFAAMQTLPGAQTSFSESGLFVRGGTAAETKTYFDGMLVKSPFNATVPNQASRGRLSAFLFKGTSFSAGGYSAQYGQALSSALILESTDLPEKTTTGISLLSVGGAIDQNIRFKNSAVSIGGYYFNLAPAYQFIKQRQAFIKAPEQAGGTFQYKAKTSETGLFKLYASYGKTRLSLNTADIDAPGASDFFSNRNHNVYINSTYKEALGGRWKIEGGISYTNDGDRGLMAAASYQRTDHLFQGRAVLTRNFGRWSNFKFGAETYATGRSESLDGRSREYDDQLSSAFAETDLFITRRLVARMGLRTEYSSYLGRYNVAPRTSLAFKTGAHAQVAMAYGRFYQNPEDDHLVLQPLDFEQADHYMLRYEVNTAARNFRAEGYYKTYDQLTKTTGGTLDNSGSGYARGLDIFWRDKKSLPGADYRISYSFLDTKRDMLNFPGKATPGFAAKHTLNAIYSEFISKIKSQVGAGYTFASGRTYENPNNPVYRADRTKNYHNISLTVSYLTSLLKQFTVLYVNATNITGFKNVYGYQYSADGSTRREIGPSSRRDVFIGLLMTIGDNTFVR